MYISPVAFSHIPFQIKSNTEVENIVKIMGLQFGKEYTDVSQLRYGHILVMTDQVSFYTAVHNNTLGPTGSRWESHQGLAHQPFSSFLALSAPSTWIFKGICDTHC